MQDDCVLKGCTKLNEHATCSKATAPGTISIKFDTNKPDFSMITYELMEAVSRVRAFGAKKYNRDNYKISGFKYTRSCAAALRHVFAFLKGEDNDPESGESHIAHAVCCLEHLLYDLKNHPVNDDRFKPEQK